MEVHRFASVFAQTGEKCFFRCPNGMDTCNYIIFLPIKGAKKNKFAIPARNCSSEAGQKKLALEKEKTEPFSHKACCTPSLHRTRTHVGGSLPLLSFQPLRIHSCTYGEWSGGGMSQARRALRPSPDLQNQKWKMPPDPSVRPRTGQVEERGRKQGEIVSSLLRLRITCCEGHRTQK